MEEHNVIPPLEPSKKDEKKVFISHASEDKERFVQKFSSRLREHGVDAWVDFWEILPGDSLVDKIFEEGIKKARAVIVVISHHSVEKPWVREELNASFVKRLSGKCRVIPVIIDNCEVPESLKSTVWQRITNIEDYDNEFQRILDAIYGRIRKPPLGQPAAIIRRDRFYQDLLENTLPTTLVGSGYGKEDIEEYILDKNEAPTLRLNALQIFLSMGLKSANLISRLLDDPDATIRLTILRHIHKLPDPEVLDLLDETKVQKLMHDHDDDVTVAAVRVACDLADQGRIPWEILTTVNKHSYFLVRRVAISCLTETDDPDKIDLLYEFRTTSYHVSQRLIRDYIEGNFDRFNNDQKQRAIELLENLMQAKRATQNSKEKTNILLDKLKNELV